VEIVGILYVIGFLGMVVPALIGWREDVAMWRGVESKPAEALDFLRAQGCLVDCSPEASTKALFTGPFSVDGHPFFLLTNDIPRIYRGLRSLASSRTAG
jgi:hypothetical protein